MEQCSICLEGLDNGVTLACGHRFHADCLAQMASAVGTASTRRGALTACPNCRAVSRVALTPVAAFAVGDRVEALWGRRWYPGVVDAVVDGGRAYEIRWDDGDEGEVLAAHVRAAAPANPTAVVPRRPPSCLPPRHVLLQNCDDDEDDGAAFGIESSATSFSAHGSGDLRAPPAAPTPSTRRAHTRSSGPPPAPRVVRVAPARPPTRTGHVPANAITYPCPASCGCGLRHRRCGACAACRKRLGDACLTPKSVPKPTPPPPRASGPAPAPRAVVPRARPRAHPVAPLPPATRRHVASTASAWVAVCTDLLEATKDRTNMRGLRAPLASRGFICGPVHQNEGGSFIITVPPDFPCYYDVTGKDYVTHDYAQSLSALRKYLEGALALARAGGAYRTDVEYKPRAPAPKTSRFTGVSCDIRQSEGKWRASISVRGTIVAIGRFDDEDDAARAYDAAVAKYRNAPTVNFPGEAPLASVLAALPELLDVVEARRRDAAKDRPTTKFDEYDAIVAAAAADAAAPRQERSLAGRRVEPPSPVPPNPEAPPLPIELPEQRAVLFPELVGRGPPAEARNAFDQTCIDLRLESAPEALRAAMVRGRVAANAFDPSLLSGFPFRGSGGRAAPAPGDAVPPPPPRPRLDVPAPASRGAQSLAAHNTPGPAWAPPTSARRERLPGPRRDRSAVVAPDPARASTALTSKYWGVSWDKGARRWAAQYTDANGKQRPIGQFDTEEAAAHAVNAAIGALPQDVQRRRHTNLVVDGQLVPRTYKAAPHSIHGRKRRREEPAAPPAAPPQKRVSAPPPRERDDLDLDRTAEYLL